MMATSDSEAMLKREEDESADVVLANRIVEALVSNGLVSVQKVEVIRKKIASGTVSAEDWKSWVELYRPENGEGAENVNG